ncbi:ADP-ribose diphosphatase [Photobacterium phosphoreum]|uniref:ADP-ribose diphosphatase n=1 Tax=Photobacterium phosphoreum TaxID=659 RepID=UPI0007F91F89|nr:ADP-ribose diphosphatase [Photobacterium phosphoreum]MCD9471888.1 ADP-ribose diphosphatase [Photobacterium phosphoreum]MCD9503294.1 ADP-ribose diphosphatase [Photobacterium phosphoreum]OBU37105.1 ADP-ribose diphosphatase [Photobacterium phosphoreum]OBU46794.1 ADP-ribose diphosphatase [Photobacterium phosphoreum]PSW36024.1 ADP-ribose diphosphatase [Photobacterium phosphoreum]
MDKTSNSLPTQPTFNQQDVEILSTKTVYDGFFKMVKYRLRHKLFAGGWSGEFERELFERGHAAAVLPYDPVLDRVVLIEQFRVGAMAANCQPWQLEIVAGMLDHDNESPEQVVRREATEESGLVLGKTEKISRYLSSSGGCSEILDIFISEVDSRLAAGIHGVASESEDIRVHVVSRNQAYQWLESGKIENAATIIALQWLQLHHQRLRKA